MIRAGCPMQAAIELRQQQTGNLSLAIVELDRGLASGELRSMRRNIASGKAESLFATFWTKKLGIDFRFRSEGVPRLFALPEPPRIVFRPTSAHEAAGRVEGWMYYVWRPDLDRLYAQPQRKTKSKRKPGDVGRLRPRSTRTSRNGCRKDTASTWRQTRDWRRSCGTWPSHTCSNWQRPSTRL